MTKGHIILLNGITSAGKSTLSRALQGALDEPHYYVAMDTFNEIICPFTAGHGKFADPAIMDRAVSVMFFLMRDFSARGLPVIADCVMGDHSRWLAACVEALCDYPVLYVRVACDREVALERARQRGYTSPERLQQIDRQIAGMGQHGIYDLIIDTSTHTIEENVEILRGVLQKAEKWDALQRLRTVLDTR